MRQINWRLRLRSDPEKVFALLATAEGRARFWAVEAPERDGSIHFRFADGTEEVSPIVRREPPHLFELVYFGAPTRFLLAADGKGGCELALSASVPDGDYDEVNAGWVSVLLILKAAADFGIDLRNGEPGRTWREGFVDQ